MNKTSELITVGIIIVVLAASFYISGCSPQPAAPNDQQGQQPAGPNGQYGPGMRGGNFTGPRGNLTAEQRQQLMEQRLKGLTDACANKAEGDSCTLENPRGNLTGSCAMMNSTLGCNASFSGRGFNRPTN